MAMEGITMRKVRVVVIARAFPRIFIRREERSWEGWWVFLVCLVERLDGWSSSGLFGV